LILSIFAAVPYFPSVMDVRRLMNERGKFGLGMVMSQGRGHFVCGAIFGIALGFAVGHLLVQGNAGRGADVLIAVPDPSDPMPAQVALLNSEGGGGGSVFDRYPVSGPEGASAVPKVVTADAFRGTPAAPPEEPKTLPRTEALPLPLPAPAPLAVPGPAGRASEVDPELRELLEDELQSVPPQQKEVWRDALDGVPAGDAAEILRMWKTFGRQPGPGGPVPLFPKTAEVPLAAAVLPSRSAAAGRTLRDVAPKVWRQLSRDLVHAETPGYLRSIPVLANGAGDGTDPIYRVVCLSVDFSSRSVTSTGNTSDVALYGPGFLQVATEAGAGLTRIGSLSIDPERRLSVELAGKLLPLVPEVRIPAEGRRMVIGPDGQVSVQLAGKDAAEVVGRIEIVRVLNPRGLVSDGVTAGLFTLTAASGEPSSVSSSDSTIVQGHLELSNVDPAETQRWLDRLEALATAGQLAPERPEQSAGSHPGE